MHNIMYNIYIMYIELSSLNAKTCILYPLYLIVKFEEKKIGKFYNNITEQYIYITYYVFTSKIFKIKLVQMYSKYKETYSSIENFPMLKPHTNYTY